MRSWPMRNGRQLVVEVEQWLTPAEPLWVVQVRPIGGFPHTDDVERLREYLMDLREEMEEEPAAERVHGIGVPVDRDVQPCYLTMDCTYEGREVHVGSHLHRVKGLAVSHQRHYLELAERKLQALESVKNGAESGSV